MPADELINNIYIISGCILVVELLRFTIDYAIRPLYNWISSMFSEDWSIKK